MAAGTNYLENYQPEMRINGGMATALPVNFGGVTIDASGNTQVAGTFGSTGAATFSSSVAVTGAMSAGSQTEKTQNSAAAGATVVLTAADSGKTLINVSTSGSPSWTLPTAANGLYFTFVCGNTTAGFTVTSSTAVIHFKTSASGTVLTSTTTLTNTQGTAIVGDFISIISDGTAWWMTGISGIFAAS